jgi:hypothetical protein
MREGCLDLFEREDDQQDQAKICLFVLVASTRRFS